MFSYLTLSSASTTSLRSSMSPDLYELTKGDIVFSTMESRSWISPSLPSLSSADAILSRMPDASDSIFPIEDSMFFLEDSSRSSSDSSLLRKSSTDL